MKKENQRKEDFSRRQIMTPKEAAQYLGLQIITVYRLIKKGEIPGFRVGGQWRFKKDLLDAWIVGRIKRNSEKK
jgi:excisionase family DNA binding protein